MKWLIILICIIAIIFLFSFLSTLDDALDKNGAIAKIDADDDYTPIGFLDISDIDEDGNIRKKT